MRKRLALALATAVVSSLALVSPADATHSWGGYHWARTGTSFTLKVGNNVSGPNWPGHLLQSVGDWNATPTAVLLAAAPGSSNKRCSMLAGTVQVCNGTYGNNGWLGLASINITGLHITQGSAKMNDTYFNTATYGNPNEREHVMCQEIGHTFGLDHQSTDGSSQNSCMDYFSNTGGNATSTLSTKPNQHDYDELKIIYEHLDNSTTVAASTATAGSRNEVGNDRSTWGQEIERGAHGEFSVFERDFGNGEKVVTHVTWANESDSFGQAHRPS